MEANRRPLARSEGLIIEELGDELLVYDLNADVGHCLSPDAARVWKRCDGRTPCDGLAAQVDLSAGRVETALDELERSELLEESAGHTRRELGLKMAKVSAAAAAAPLIISIAAPTAAQAVTPSFCAQFSSGNCGSNSGCTSTVGCCCCTPPIMPPYPAGEPCATFVPNDSQCKSCVPVDQQFTLCPQFDHGSMSDCSAGG